MATPKRSFVKTMRKNEVPEKIAMNKSGANKVAIYEINDRALRRRSLMRQNPLKSPWP